MTSQPEYASWNRQRGQIPLRYILMFVAAALVLATHLAIGSNVFVVVLALLSVSVGAFLLARYGALNLGALLVFLVTFRYVGFPLVAKLVIGQPLDSNLGQPLGSFTVVLMGVGAYFAAFQLSAHLDTGRPLLEPVLDARRLRAVSFLATIVGGAASLDVAVHVTEAQGITVAAFFTPLLHLGLITAVAAAITQSKHRRTWDTWVIAVALLDIGFAMILNSRLVLMETVIIYVLTVAAFRGKLTAREFATLGIAAIVLVFVITPAFLSVRSTREDLSWSERIQATMDAATHWRETLRQYNQQYNQTLSDSPPVYALYYGAPQNTVDRVSLISNVDVLKTGADMTGQVGLEDLSFSWHQVLPRVVSPDKQLGFSQGAWLYCRLRIICVPNYQMTPLIGEAYAAFGWIGVLLYPFIFGSVLLLMIKKMAGWNCYNNIWVIFFVILVHDQFAEGSTEQYMTMIGRSLPQLFVFMLIFQAFAGTSRLVRRRPQFTAAANEN